ncbi:MAG: hypothetical protein A3F73_13765 [Gallionellales bacterium RIFCSPLOWO2_12_FULL_59_22]|nr:MAG: hypothetical protein A3F73_13765 [Gallionellales bacterium RIFCSPLOWO2_12_FULL_59_22]
MGTVIADTSITVGGGNVSGRVLAGAVTATGIVTMPTGGNTIGGCSAPVLPPTLGKAFSPATINAGGASTLTITLSNPDAAIATLSSALTDTLPGGVVIAPAPAAATTCGGGAAVTAIAGAGAVALSSGSTIPATGSCTVTVNVTAAIGGSYINTLNIGALATSNGNNAGPAIATLTVVSPVLPPTLGKAFGPATINAGGVSTLTITLSNPDAAVATLSSALTDTLPGGVVIAPVPAAATTCGGGAAVTAIAGAGAVVLSSGSTIPATGSCTVTVNVTAAVGGTYINTLNIGALATSNGSNAAAAIATLTVPAIAITTLTTQASFGVTLGGAISDTATLSGGTAPTGAITFNLYGPNDALCSGAAIFTTPVAVNGNGNYSSAPFTPVAIGTYRWVANYGGDTNNAATTNGCNALNESVGVTAVMPIAAAGIPTLSEWAMIMLAAFLVITGFAAMRRQAR